MELKRARMLYALQQCAAVQRGVEWRLTFQEWLDWWGDDLDRRGRGVNQLQMQRIWDAGPYAIGNIKKGTPRENSKTAAKVRRNKDGEERRKAHQAALDAAPVDPEKEWSDPDEESISSYMSRDHNKIGGDPENIWDRIARF